MEQQQLLRVNVNELLGKFQSKKELFNFLTLDCKAFLPKVRTTNTYFYKQILRGQKEYIRRDQVKVISLPHIEGLTIQDLINFVRLKPEFAKYLPDERDWVHLDRDWLGNVLYTLDPQGINAMLNQALNLRKAKIEQSQNLNVEMRPEFANALQSCLNFSTHRGKSAFLLKNSSKRKRSQFEVEEVKDEEDLLKQDKQGYLQQAKRLKSEREQLEQELMLLRNDHQIVEGLIREGVLDPNANQQQF